MTVVVVVLIENYRCKFSFCTSLGPGSAMAEKGKKRGQMWPVHRRYFIFLFVLYENIRKLASEASAESEKEK